MNGPAIDPARLDLAAEYRARPFGRHSPALQAMLDVMYRAENCQNLILVGIGEGRWVLGERRPDIVSMDPSWHHNYASLGWWGGPPAPAELHYPSIKPELVGLIDALHGIAHEAERRAEYLADRAAYAERFRLTPDQRAALVALDHKAIVAMGTHPLLPFLARMQVDRPGR